MLTILDKKIDDYAVDILELFISKKIDCLKITNVAIVSVVPMLNKIILDSVKRFFSGEVKIFGENLKSDIKIEIQNKKEVGHDRLVNAIAGYKKYGGNLLIIDLGTATTFDVVGVYGQYLGGVIAPGVNLSIKTLHEMTAKLPKIQLKSQENVIGRNTYEAINSGIYFGYISLLEGLILKIEKEYGSELKILFTGGFANLFSEAISNKNIIDENLTLEGLMIASGEMI